MGVDQKRPLVGFALVAVLCAVLMLLSIGRGWALDDLFQPARPIAAALVEPQVETSPPSAEPDPVRLPAELSAQPLGVAVPSAAPVHASTPAPGRKAPRAALTAVSVPDAAKAQREAERDAAKAQRKAERDAAKAQRKAEREAAKAQRKAEREAAKADRRAEREAAKAQHKAERDAAKGARPHR